MKSYNSAIFLLYFDKLLTFWHLIIALKIDIHNMKLEMIALINYIHQAQCKFSVINIYINYMFSITLTSGDSSRVRNKKSNNSPWFFTWKKCYTNINIVYDYFMININILKLYIHYHTEFHFIWIKNYPLEKAARICKYTVIQFECCMYQSKFVIK